MGGRGGGQNDNFSVTYFLNDPLSLFFINTIQKEKTKGTKAHSETSHYPKSVANPKMIFFTCY